MGIIQLLLIAVGLSMDAFAVSVTNGMTINNLRLRDALKFGLFFGVFQALMPLIGYGAGSVFSSYVSAVDHYIAFFLLAFIGGRMIYEAVKGGGEQTADNPHKFSVLLFLAIATSIDALAVGVTFAFMDVEIFSSVVIIGVTTFLISFFGVLLGKRLGNILGNKAELFGGAILILIGLKILIEDLFF